MSNVASTNQLTNNDNYLDPWIANSQNFCSKPKFRKEDVMLKRVEVTGLLRVKTVELFEKWRDALNLIASKLGEPVEPIDVLSLPDGSTLLQQ